MIRSANHSSFPRVGESPLDQQLRRARRAFDRGGLDAEALRAVRDEVIGLAVAEQSRAFVDIVTDGQVAWDGPLSHVARHLTGVEPGPLRRWFTTNFHDRIPRVTAAVGRAEPFLVHDYEVASQVAVGQARTVKPVLPGPVAFARLARDEHYGDLDRLADAVAEALAAEVAALAAAGATVFQLDEPLLCRHPEDVERVRRATGRVFEAAGAGATTILSTYFGDLEALADRLAELPGTHLGLDLTVGAAGAAPILRLPENRGVALGVFDSTTSLQEDAADVAARLEPFREALLGRDVIVGPNAGLEPLPRDQAFDKLLHSRYLVEKLEQEWPWPS